MAKLAGILGVCALVFAIIDLIHGPHNGDEHRFVIHIFEFVSLFGLLCVLEVWAFKAVPWKYNMNHWLVATFLSLLSCIFGFILFFLSGGSFHGDGGPIAASFGLLGFMSEIVFPISLIGFVLVAIRRKRNGVPVLDR